VIPSGAKIRVVGDVHGDIKGFSAACATDRFILQLGDLVDEGPDSAGVLRLMFDVIDHGRGGFLLGNHERKLGRWLHGENVRPGPALEATRATLDAALIERTLLELDRAPLWIGYHSYFFVHAAFHRAMLTQNPPPGLGPTTPLLSRALFGQVVSGRKADGYPERVLNWVGHIPQDLRVFCGHDQRSNDGRPYVVRNDLGGEAVFLDTGAGKGGHLSWIDLD
jgi:protein phosphatase